MALSRRSSSSPSSSSLVLSLLFVLPLLASSFFSPSPLRMSATDASSSSTSSSSPLPAAVPAQTLARKSQRPSSSSSSPAFSRGGILRQHLGTSAALAAFLFTTTTTTTTPFSLTSPIANAAIKASSLEDGQKAAREVKACLRSLRELQAAGVKGDWQTVGEGLQRKEFKNFENSATVLVRCEKLSAEDKTALGTIRRFGIIADYLITLGGLEAELKTGGVLASDEDAGIDDEGADGEKNVNRGEALKYLRLAIGSLQDIDRIAETLLPESEQQY